jgi:hypothetical protein
MTPRRRPGLSFIATAVIVMVIAVAIPITVWFVLHDRPEWGDEKVLAAVLTAAEISLGGLVGSWHFLLSRWFDLEAGRIEQARSRLRSEVLRRRVRVRDSQLGQMLRGRSRRDVPTRVVVPLAFGGEGRPHIEVND